MKQFLPKLTLSLLLVSLTTMYATAQTAAKGSATISHDLVVHLDEASPLVADYTFDISTMSFKNKEAAERYFSLCRDNILSYTVDFDAKVATVHLMLEYMAPRGWDVKQYNEYFLKVGERYRNTLQVVNE